MSKLATTDVHIVRVKFSRNQQETFLDLQSKKSFFLVLEELKRICPGFFSRGDNRKFRRAVQTMLAHLKNSKRHGLGLVASIQGLHDEKIIRTGWEKTGDGSAERWISVPTASCPSGYTVQLSGDNCRRNVEILKLLARLENTDESVAAGCLPRENQIFITSIMREETRGLSKRLRAAIQSLQAIVYEINFDRVIERIKKVFLWFYRKKKAKRITTGEALLYKILTHNVVLSLGPVMAEIGKNMDDVRIVSKKLQGELDKSFPAQINDQANGEGFYTFATRLLSQVESWMDLKTELERSTQFKCEDHQLEIIQAADLAAMMAEIRGLQQLQITARARIGHVAAYIADAETKLARAFTVEFDRLSRKTVKYGTLDVENGYREVKKVWEYFLQARRIFPDLNCANQYESALSSLTWRVCELAQTRMSFFQDRKGCLQELVRSLEEASRNRESLAAVQTLKSVME